MAGLLLEGRLDVQGPGGDVVIEADRRTVRIRFQTLRSILSAWRHFRKAPIRQALGRSDIAVEVYVRGVLIRRFGRA